MTDAVAERSSVAERVLLAILDGGEVDASEIRLALGEVVTGLQHIEAMAAITRQAKLVGDLYARFLEEADSTDPEVDPLETYGLFAEAMSVLQRMFDGYALGKDPTAVRLGRRGGLKGGRAANAQRTPEQRRAIASHAARQRWRKAG